MANGELTCLHVRNRLEEQTHACKSVGQWLLEGLPSMDRSSQGDSNGGVVCRKLRRRKSSSKKIF